MRELPLYFIRQPFLFWYILEYIWIYGYVLLSLSLLLEFLAIHIVGGSLFLLPIENKNKKEETNIALLTDTMN